MLTETIERQRHEKFVNYTFTFQKTFFAKTESFVFNIAHMQKQYKSLVCHGKISNTFLMLRNSFSAKNDTLELYLPRFAKICQCNKSCKKPFLRLLIHLFVILLIEIIVRQSFICHEILLISFLILRNPFWEKWYHLCLNLCWTFLAKKNDITPELHLKVIFAKTDTFVCNIAHKIHRTPKFRLLREIC